MEACIFMNVQETAWKSILIVCSKVPELRHCRKGQEAVIEGNTSTASSLTELCIYMC